MAVQNEKGLVDCLIRPYENGDGIEQCFVVALAAAVLSETAYAAEFMICKRPLNGMAAMKLAAFPLFVAAAVHKIGFVLYRLGETGGYQKIGVDHSKQIKKQIVRTLTVISGIATAIFLIRRAPFTVLNSVKIMGLTAVVTLPSIGLLAFHKRMKSEVNFWTDKITTLFVGAQAGFIVCAIGRGRGLKKPRRLRDLVLITQGIGAVIMLMSKKEIKYLDGCVATVFGTTIFALIQGGFSRLRFEGYASKMGVLKSYGIALGAGVGTWLGGGALTNLLKTEENKYHT